MVIPKRNYNGHSHGAIQLVALPLSPKPENLELSIGSGFNGL